jgi:hypothetical protein
MISHFIRRCTFGARQEGFKSKVICTDLGLSYRAPDIHPQKFKQCSEIT